MPVRGLALVYSLMLLGAAVAVGQSASEQADTPQADAERADTDRAASEQRGAPRAEDAVADDAQPFRVGFRVFDTSRVAEQYRYLARSLPSMLRKRLEAVGVHRLDAAEREAYAAERKERRLAELGQELDSLVSERSELLFQELSRSELRQRRDELASRIREARTALEEAEAESVEVEQRMPVVFPQEPTDLLAVEGSPLRLAEREDFDLIVGGELDRVENYLYVRVWAYHRAHTEEVFESSTTALPEEVRGSMDTLVDELATALLGRPWARLSVRASSDRAAIYVDSKLAGFGSAELPFLSSGTHEIRVVGQQGRPVTKTVELTERAEETVVVELPEPDSEQVRIRTEPGGAELYDGALWQGTTPLSLPRPETRRALRLRKEGHYESRVVLSPDAPEELSYQLVPDTRDRGALLQERRDRFYRSLGWFALSLPLPIMLNGAQQNLATLVNSPQGAELSADATERIVRTGNTLYWSYWGSVGISAGLFVKLVVDIVRYIRASEYAHFEQGES
jgi:hypothetical protein